MKAHAMGRLLAPTALALAGCAVPFQPPPSGPTATVIFSSATEPVMVQAFADRACNAHPQGNRLAYFFRDHFDRRTGTPRVVPAQREFVFTFRVRRDDGASATECQATRVFTPEAGRTYRAHFALFPRHCEVTITREDASAGGALASQPVVHDAVQPPCFNSLNG